MARLRHVWATAALVVALAALAPACGGSEENGTEPAGPASAPETQRPPGSTGKPGEDDRRAEDGSEGRGGSGGDYDPSRPDTEGNDVPPPAGSPAERFERFCERNPRECY